MKIFSILANPFEDIAERKLIFFGILSFIMGTMAAYLLGGSYPGMMSFKSNSATLLQLIYQNSINTILLTLLLFALAKILYSKTRFLDILITVLIARSAIYVMALLNTKAWLNPISEHISKNVLNTQSGSTIEKSDLLLLFLGVLIIILLVVYFFYLLIKGFRIATNSKKGYHALIVLLLVFIGEAIASMFIPYYI